MLGALRVLNRLEQVAETLRAALNAVAAEAPDWLRAIVPPEWFERYSCRVEDYRLPRGNEAREQYAILVGADGMRLLEAIDGPTAPPALRLLPAVEVLRRTWVQQYVTLAGVLQLREPKSMPPASAQVESPYETEACYGTKRDRSWIGYKVHLSESCDDDCPHLLTHVETPRAPATDVEQLAAMDEEQPLAHAFSGPIAVLADRADQCSRRRTRTGTVRAFGWGQVDHLVPSARSRSVAEPARDFTDTVVEGRCSQRAATRASWQT